MILDVGMCQNTVLAWRIIGFVIMVLKILVPIIIIVTSVIPLFNALIKGTADETIKSWKQIGRKIAAGIIIFLIPSFISGMIHLLANQDLVNEDTIICSECVNSPGGSKCQEYVDKLDKMIEEEKEDFEEEEIHGSTNTSEMTDSTKEDSENKGNNNDSNSSNSSNGDKVTASGTGNTQAGDYRDIANAAYEGDKAAREKIIEILAPAAQAAWKRDGYLPSVLIAQAIMESGWLKSQLAYDYNNVMSMNSDLNNSLWTTIDWDGTSTKIRVVHGGDNNTYYTYDEMRVYKSIEQCFLDYSHFATTYKNGKYAGIIGNKDPEYVIEAFMPGYTESVSARDQVRKIIRDYDLTKYDIDR